MRFVTALLAIFFAVAGQALAAERYAEPAGDGPEATCPQANPCNIQVAVEGPSVVAGDEVILLAGTYAEADVVEITDAITVRGNPGLLMPSIVSTAPLSAVQLNNANAVLRNVAINQIGGVNALGLFSGTAERVRVHSTGLYSCGVVTSGSVALLRDSICHNERVGGQGRALATTVGGGVPVTAQVRNVTAYAEGANSFGVYVDAIVDGHASVDLKNVIAHGDQADVRAGADATSTAAITMTSSNYATELQEGAGATVTNPGSGGNQTQPPLLLDPENGNFAELPASPTIDNGLDDPALGTTDFEGDPRVQGNGVDIGADEAADPNVPETTIDSGPEGAIGIATANFTFSSNETAATFECSFDGAAYAACGSPQSFSGLADGAHVFAVRAGDNSGNTDATPASRSFTVDTLAPDTKLTKKPKKKLALKPGKKAAKAKFKFKANENGVKFECKVDKAAFKSCASPLKLKAKKGTHRLQVRSADAAGNVDATPAKAKFKVLGAR